MSPIEEAMRDFAVKELKKETDKDKIMKEWEQIFEMNNREILIEILMRLRGNIK